MNSNSRPLSIPANAAATNIVHTRRATACRLRAIEDAFTLPSYPDLTAEHVVFILWYTYTTKLSFDGISHLFRTQYPSSAAGDSITRWHVQEVIVAMEARWDAGGQKMGDFKLLKPTGLGWCPCDMGKTCTKLKRSRGTREDRRAAQIAFSIWDGTFADLLKCPRGLDNGIQQKLALESQRAQTIRVRRNAAQSSFPVYATNEVSYLQSRIDKTGAWLQGFLPFFLRRIMAIAAYFCILDYFYMPESRFNGANIDGILRRFFHTTYGFAIALGLVETSLHNLFMVSEDVVKFREVYRHHGFWTAVVEHYRITCFLMSWIRPFVCTALAAFVALWVCSYLGLIEHWKHVTHPDDMGKMRQTSIFWTSLPQPDASGALSSSDFKVPEFAMATLRITSQVWQRIVDHVQGRGAS